MLPRIDYPDPRLPKPLGGLSKYLPSHRFRWVGDFVLAFVGPRWLESPPPPSCGGYKISPRLREPVDAPDLQGLLDPLYLSLRQVVKREAGIELLAHVLGEDDVRVVIPPRENARLAEGNTV